MGCFTETCAVSQLPVEEGDAVFLLALKPDEDDPFPSTSGFRQALRRANDLAGRTDEQLDELFDGICDRMRSRLDPRLVWDAVVQFAGFGTYDGCGGIEENRDGDCRPCEGGAFVVHRRILRAVADECGFDVSRDPREWMPSFLEACFFARVDLFAHRYGPQCLEPEEKVRLAILDESRALMQDKLERLGDEK